jgi:small subunit ribosomal protein S6
LRYARDRATVERFWELAPAKEVRGILRPYEILVAIDSRPTDEEVAASLTTLEQNLRNLGAEVTRVENWGKRRLAHDIRKQREATYAVFEASAEPAMVKEFERQLRLNEAVLRFISTRVPARKRARPAETPEAVTEEVT